jgi:hypothetical protein
MENETLQSLMNWYASHCNGDWEHSYGIKIETLDNPGWDLRANLNGSGITLMDFDSGLIEQSENDWYRIINKNNEFGAYGDPRKLTFLLRKLLDEVTKDDDLKK